MAEAYLSCPDNWTKISLEPNSKSHYIVRADSGGTPSTTVETYWDGDIPWLTPKEITTLDHSIYVSHTERMITSTGLKNSAAKLLPVGTVMLSKRAPVGAVAVNAVPMSTNQGFLNFQCGRLLRPLYLALWLRLNKPYLDKVANGSTYPELYVSDLFEFTVSVPPLEVQDRIISIFSSLQFASLLGLTLQQSALSPQRMVEIQSENRRLMEIRNLLLYELLSGRIGVMETTGAGA